MQQAERYGTPLGQSLRVMAQENRDMRMNEAEKKAAGAAAEADRADDPVLPAGAVRRHSRADRHQGRRDAVGAAIGGRTVRIPAFTPWLLCLDDGHRCDDVAQRGAGSARRRRFNSILICRPGAPIVRSRAR